MDASVIDLRYRMNDVLKALDRNENVRILYHGKEKGVITSCVKMTSKAIKDHPFFDMQKIEGSVAEQMSQVRGGRFNAL